jgi:hypothetical protein
MEIVIDEHAKMVLEFMQENIPASRLIGVAESLPQMARAPVGNHPTGAYSSTSTSAS